MSKQWQEPFDGVVLVADFTLVDDLAYVNRTLFRGIPISGEMQAAITKSAPAYGVLHVFPVGFPFLT